MGGKYAADIRIQDWIDGGNSGLPPCPVFTGLNDAGEMIGSQMKAVGGCIDNLGFSWSGTMTITYDATLSETQIFYEDWTFDSVEDACGGRVETNKLNGLVKLRPLPSEAKAPFSLPMAIDAVAVLHESDFDPRNNCAAEVKHTAYDIEITQTPLSDSPIPETQSVYSGGGFIGLHVVNGVSGRFISDTVDEVVNVESCASEALSGQSTFSSQNNETIITYDGATDCDEASTGMVSINGGEAFEVEGGGCVNANLPKGILAFLMTLGVTVLLRRRDESVID